MRSMTGFGSARGDNVPLGISLRVEISSINRKQFELKCALPHELSQYEYNIRQLVSGKITRGSLYLRVELIPYSADGCDTGIVNMDLAVRMSRAAKQLAVETGIDIQSAAAILAIPAISENLGLAGNGPGLEKLLLETVSRALENLQTMKEFEGANLGTDLIGRISLLENTLSEIEPLVHELPKQQYDRLLTRAREAGFETDLSDERFLRELVIFTDKSDVTEEIVRLKSHFVHFREVLANTADAVGRTLDFLTQEIFREINTLGNKAPLPEVSRRIVTMKTEVEKIREQVQNVE